MTNWRFLRTPRALRRHKRQGWGLAPAPDLVRLCLRCRKMNMKMVAAITGTPTLTPTPIPALAPVERPPEPELDVDAVAVGSAVGLNDMVLPALGRRSPIWLRVGWPLTGFDTDAALHVQSSCLISISSWWWAQPENRSMSAPSHLASATHCWPGYPALVRAFR